MWDEDDGEQEDISGCDTGLLADLHQSGSCHPLTSAGLLADLHQSGSCHPSTSAGLLPPDDELPLEVKQEEYSEDSMVTDLFLDSDLADEDPSPGLTKECGEGIPQSGGLRDLVQAHHEEKQFIC